MNCECPKCSSNIEVAEPAVPEKGEFVRCPDCSSRFWLQRETSFLKSLKKEGKIYCSQCGNEPGSDTYCKSCFAQFADYWLVQTAKPSRKQVHPKGSRPSVLANSPRIFKKSATAPPKIRKRSGPISQKLAISLAVAMVLLAGALLGGFKYLAYKERMEFTNNYIKGLYAIQSGIDHSQQSLERMLKANGLLNDKDATRLKRVDSQIKEFMAKLGHPPQEFLQAAADLNALFMVYSEYYGLAATESGASQKLPDKMRQLDVNLAKVQTQLKKELPEDLSQNIQLVSNRYKNLAYLNSGVNTQPN